MCPTLLKKRSISLANYKEMTENDVKFITKVNEVSKTIGYFPEKPEKLTKSSTPEQSSSSNEGIVENTIEKICP